VTLGRLIQLRGWVAYGLAMLYAIAGGVGLLFAEFDDTRSKAIWVVLLWGGAALLLGCIFLANASSWPAAVLMSLGAAAGGLALFWTFLVPVAVAGIIATSFAIVRRSPKTA
jgi:hypothetical protein